MPSGIFSIMHSRTFIQKQPRMLNLSPLSDPDIAIRPRWPAREDYITEGAYQQLKKVQSILQPHDISLVLTQGYELETKLHKLVHRLSRALRGSFFVSCALNKEAGAARYFVLMAMTYPAPA